MVLKNAVDALGGARLNVLKTSVSATIWPDRAKPWCFRHVGDTICTHSAADVAHVRVYKELLVKISTNP